MSRVKTVALSAEFIALFVCVPGVFAVGILPLKFIYLFGVLLGLSLWCFFALLVDRNFDNRRFWEIQRLWPDLARIFLTFLMNGFMLILAIFAFSPDAFLNLLINAPKIWFGVILLYPLISALPQELVYRSFFFYRYKPIMPSRWTRIIISALVFSFMHIIFQNWVAIVLTLFGGLLFGRTYARTRSLVAVTLEHTLYGWAIFTFGYGKYFYHVTAGM